MMMNRGYEFVSVIILLCACLVNGQYNQFIETFPQVNKTALKELQGLGPKSAFDGFMPQSIPLSPCPSLPVPADTDNVNNLRPGNIKVVMAMGDSITAGMSAKDTTFLSMKEYRGLAYSIGGDAGITTVPNLLLPYVGAGYPIGASKGIGKRDMKTNGFNAAVSGAINIDLLSQAQWLVKTLKANKAIDYTRDWKLLTVWIGSNNLCDVCSDESNNNADNFEKYVTEALEYIHANVPRVFVNLVVNLDITQLDSITKGLCNILHSVACSCVTKENNKAKVLKANIEYQQRAPKIAQKFAAKNDPQFAVVVQPFLAQTLIEERSELSKADCFHPSSYSHGVAAIALWNNMISPAAQKKSAWKLNDVPVCATPDTLLYTH